MRYNRRSYSGISTRVLRQRRNPDRTVGSLIQRRQYSRSVSRHLTNSAVGNSATMMGDVAVSRPPPSGIQRSLRVNSNSAASVNAVLDTSNNASRNSTRPTRSSRSLSRPNRRRSVPARSATPSARKRSRRSHTRSTPKGSAKRARTSKRRKSDPQSSSNVPPQSTGEQQSANPKQEHASEGDSSTNKENTPSAEKEPSSAQSAEASLGRSENQCCSALLPTPANCPPTFSIGSRRRVRTFPSLKPPTESSPARKTEATVQQFATYRSSWPHCTLSHGQQLSTSNFNITRDEQYVTDSTPEPVEPYMTDPDSQDSEDEDDDVDVMIYEEDQCEEPPPPRAHVVDQNDNSSVLPTSNDQATANEEQYSSSFSTQEDSIS